MENRIFLNASLYIRIPITSVARTGPPPVSAYGKSNEVNPCSPKGHHSIGLANVNQRLRSYYGEEYGLLVESIPGEGTIIDIVLPSSAINIEPSFFQPELSKTISLSQNPSQ